MLTDQHITVLHNEVTAIDRAAKTVTLADGRKLPYTKLYLATGSSSFVPPIEGRDLQGVMTLRGLPDAERIREHLAAGKTRNIVFIGAGFISMEAATLLAEQHAGAYTITIVELMDRPLPLMLDGDMSAVVRAYLEEKGLRFRTGEKVERIVGMDGRVTGVQLASGETLDADMVFLNVGVRPNTQLAVDAGLEMAKFGIRVNTFQETSDPDILAGGDCVEKCNFLTKKPAPGPLRRPAGVHGGVPGGRRGGVHLPVPGEAEDDDLAATVGVAQRHEHGLEGVGRHPRTVLAGVVQVREGDEGLDRGGARCLEQARRLVVSPVLRLRWHRGGGLDVRGRPAGGAAVNFVVVPEPSRSTHSFNAPREIPRSAAMPFSVAPGVDSYKSTARCRNSSV